MASASPSESVRSWRTAFLTLRDETLAPLSPTTLPNLIRILVFSQSEALVLAARDLPPHEHFNDYAGQCVNAGTHLLGELLHGSGDVGYNAFGGASVLDSRRQRSSRHICAYLSPSNHYLATLYLEIWSGTLDALNSDGLAPIFITHALFMAGYIIFCSAQLCNIAILIF